MFFYAFIRSAWRSVNDHDWTTNNCNGERVLANAEMGIMVH
jgi:hypothetical protein